MTHCEVSANYRNGNGSGRRIGLLSVVIPCKNEDAVLRVTHARLVSALNDYGAGLELIYVDDGSTDSTFEVLRALQSQDARVRIVKLSRNFGHQVALTAGIEYASGEAVVIIDADLQDPPEVVPAMVEKWLDGYDVAYGVRLEREGESLFKLYTAKVFYRLMTRLSATPITVDTGDFRLMDRKVVNALLRMPERDRFLRGMITWLGFRQVAVPYRRATRHAGETKYPFLKMVRFALDGISSFSVIPLKIATWLGFFASAVALILVGYALFVHLLTNKWVTGWASLFIAVLFMGGAQLVCLGIIGEYVGRIYGESKRRPLYVVQDLLGFRESQPQHESAQVDLEYAAKLKG